MTGHGAGAPGLSDGDMLALLILAPLGFGVVAGAVGARVLDGALVDWLLEHSVVVPAEQALVPVPGFSGAGLDLHRLIGAVLLLGAVVATAVMLRAARRAQR